MNRRQVRWLFLVVAVLFLAGGITDPAGSRVHADDTARPEAYKDLADHNPIMTQRFGADPYAMVYDGRVYVYMTHDVIQRNHEGEIVENTYGEINSINCLSDRKSTRLNSSHVRISYAVFCLKKKKIK